MQKQRNRNDALIQGILFDWNGVLMDDETLHYEAFRQTLKEQGYLLSEETYQQYCQGRRDLDGWSALSRWISISISIEACMARKAALYRAMVDQYPEYSCPGRQMITSLEGRVAIAIVTSSPLSEVLIWLKRWNLEKSIDCLITAEDVTYGKPHPEGYLKAASSLGLDPSQCLVVEDTLNNLHALINHNFHLVFYQSSTEDGYSNTIPRIASLDELLYLDKISSLFS